jgi:hypothetical protein
MYATFSSSGVLISMSWNCFWVMMLIACIACNRCWKKHKTTNYIQIFLNVYSQTSCETVALMVFMMIVCGPNITRTIRATVLQLQSNLPIRSPLLSSQLYWKGTFSLSFHGKCHMNWPSFKRPSVLKDHFFFIPKVIT